MSSSQGVPQPFSCPSCSQAFTRRENLERHRKSRHGLAGTSSYECPLCHAFFNRRDIWKRHRDRCDGRRSTRNTRRTTVSEVASKQGLHEENGEHGDIASVLDFPATATVAPLSTGLHDTSSNDKSESPANNQPRLCSVPLESMPCCISYYFSEFHHSFPIIHKPTFSLSKAPVPLRDIIVAIGNLYCKGYPHPPDVVQSQSDGLWESCVASLQDAAISDPGRFKESWILQATLLCIVYAAFSANQFPKGHHLLTALVSDIREAGLFNQHTYSYFYSDWRQALEAGVSLLSVDVEDLWRSYTLEESMKHCIYAVSMVDLHLVLACNTRALVSPMELIWDLPWSTKAWEAATADEWWQTLSQEATSYAVLDNVGIDRGSAVKTLFLATQTLLSSVPSSSLLQALSLNSFATYCVTGNIYRLARDLTHSLYQFPPSPANPSPFHMLSHSQNSQITTALKAIQSLRGSTTSMTTTTITGTATANTSNDNNTTNVDSLWDAVQILSWVTKVSLCVPDDFLICGIVDTDIAAAFATAAHMSLGDQILGRRARNMTILGTTGGGGSSSASNRPFGEQGFTLILEELMSTMNIAFGSPPHQSRREPPWVSVVVFRNLLDLYRILRLAGADIRERSAAAAAATALNPLAAPLLSSSSSSPLGKGVVGFDAARVLHATVQDALTRHIRAKRQVLATRDLEQLGLLELMSSSSSSSGGNGGDGQEGNTTACEKRFTILMAQACGERDVWAVGPAMSAVLEEISTLRGDS